MKNKTMFWMTLTLGVFMTTLKAPAQDAAAGDTADVPVVAEEGFNDVTIAINEGAEPEEDTENLISVAFEDASLDTVVSVFTKWSGANIIADPSNLTGRVTVSLENVAWKPALGAILAQHNLSLQEHTQGSSVYAISPISPDAPPPMLVENYFLDYASVGDMSSIVTSILRPGGSISPFPSRNILVVRTTENNHGEIKSVIEAIDIPREQVYIEVKVLELDETAIKDLGINWQSLQGYELSASDLLYTYDSATVDTRGNSSSRARTDERTKTDHLNQQFDIDGVQFESDGQVFFADPGNPGGDVKDITGPLFPTRQFRDDLLQTQTDESLVSRSLDRVITEAKGATLAAADFRVILSALNQMNGVSFVSNPKIIVANEEEARIHIGEQQPNIVGTTTPGQDGQANTVVYNLSEDQPYFQFGITLAVTPTINTESNITLHIEPVLSRFIRDVVAPDGNTFPLTSERTIVTTFNLESGKTAAIGGLTETMDRNADTAIPLLGDIPLIGKYLFASEHKEQQQRETVIFVTVGIANPATMQKNVGLPAETKLASKRLISMEQDRRKAEEELDELIKADEDMRKRQVERKARLLDKQN